MTNTGYFINLSNHHHLKWDNVQLNAAREYGEIVSIEFPQVIPEADESYVRELVDRYMGIIETYGFDNVNAVMIQGEFTFTCAMVRLLKKVGICVLSACSERNVIEKVMDDGSVNKVAIFRFVRFREYF